jgi:hypothetical protein
MTVLKNFQLTENHEIKYLEANSKKNRQMKKSYNENRIKATYQGVILCVFFECILPPLYCQAMGLRIFL